MATWNRIVLSVALVTSAPFGYAQTGARVELSNGRAAGGETISATLTFDAPIPCDTRVFLYFALVGHGTQIDISGSAPKGATSASLTGQLPLDQPGGDYLATRGLLNPCPGYTFSKTFSVTGVTLTVVPYVDANKYPTSAKVELSLTQRQFLDTKVAQLSDLNSQLNARLDQGRADLPGLRDFLTGIVASADEALSATEEQYREQIMKAQGSPPAFFADFHAQYQALLISLRAPIPGLAYEMPRAALMNVQLKQRSPERRLADTMPPVATAVWQTIKDNIAAYKFVRDNGTANFTVAITSYPPGANIQLKKLIDEEYTDYGHTNIPKATFELATWIFKFQHPECKDEQVLRIDPYVDTQPEISVEFMHCRGK